MTYAKEIPRWAAVIRATGAKNLVLVPGGLVALGAPAGAGATNARSPRRVEVSGFYLDRQDIPGVLWDEVVGWATHHGYDLPARAAGAAPLVWHRKPGCTGMDCT